MKISNPVLPGFNADPSMIRVGDTYYIANSTFDWWPGVRLHESRDMVHWNLLPGPLNRVSQLDMKGNPSGGGIWAPDLSYADGKFWLIYTDVKIDRRPAAHHATPRGRPRLTHIRRKAPEPYRECGMVRGLLVIRPWMPWMPWP